MKKLFFLLLFIPLLCTAQTIQIGEAELSKVLKDAAKGQVGEWFKYRESAWLPSNSSTFLKILKNET